jgi:hypothetical protein
MRLRVPEIRAALPAVVLVLASGAVAAAEPAPPPKEVPVRAERVEKARTLKLPETPYNYANVELPAHFNWSRS